MCATVYTTRWSFLRPRLRWALSRAAFYLSLWLAGITIDFVIPHLLPPNVLYTLIYSKLVSYGASAGMVLEYIRELEAQFGPLIRQYSEPLYVQYLQFLRDVFTLNFGVSLMYYPFKAGSIITQGVPWTAVIVYPALALSFVVGNVLGRAAALSRGTAKDYAIVAGLMFLYTMPVFVVGEVLITIFAVHYRIFPMENPYNEHKFLRPTLSLPFVASVLHHAALPVITLTLFSLAGWALGMRNNMIPILQEDFMNYYRAMGVPERVVASRAYRVALLPNFTGFAVSLGYSVLGAIAIEGLFNYAGLGYYYSQALGGMDYPLLNGILVMLVTMMVFSNFIAELIYGILDPRTSKAEVEGL